MFSPLGRGLLLRWLACWVSTSTWVWTQSLPACICGDGSACHRRGHRNRVGCAGETCTGSSTCNESPGVCPHPGHGAVLFPTVLSHYALCGWNRHAAAHTGRHFTGHAGNQSCSPCPDAAALASSACDIFLITQGLAECLMVLVLLLPASW